MLKKSKKKMARDRAEAERQGLIYFPRTEKERRVALSVVLEKLADWMEMQTV